MPFNEILTALPLNIDWQQILLHLLSFLILAVGLTFLIYRPVKKFLDNRKKRFEDMEKDIAERKQATEEMQSDYERRLSGVDDEIEYKRTVAQKEAEETAKRTTDAADEQAAEILSRAVSGAEAQKRKVMDEAGSDITGIVVAATEKLLGASQSESTDAALYDKFLSDTAPDVKADDLCDAEKRNAELTVRQADIEAERIVREARENARQEADKILETARSGLADAVALATEKMLTELNSVGEEDIYDKFLTEAARSESK